MQVLRVTMAWCWGRMQTGGKSWCASSTGGKGSAQGLESNVEEMGASPKIPALTSARWMVMSGLATMQDASASAGERAQAAIDRLQLGCRRFLCLVLMLYPPQQPQTDASPNRKSSRGAPPQRVQCWQEGTSGHVEPPECPL
jgi:hypothetical protein